MIYEFKISVIGVFDIVVIFLYLKGVEKILLDIEIEKVKCMIIVLCMIVIFFWLFCM